MYETFTHDSKYYCLVFEPLGVSMYKFLKRNAFRGFWLQDIQSFARQCLKALKFLHQKLRMTHTDLKPENILLQSAEPGRPSFFPREAAWLADNRSSSPPSTPYLRPASSEIKLIDFGNATYENEHHSSIINTRQYRGPEVVLELGWNERSDLWSLGCIFMELYTGALLFGTHENLEHLALMRRIVQPLPLPMLAAASPAAKQSYLVQDGQPGFWRLKWPEGASSPTSEQHVQNQRRLPELVPKQHQQLTDLVGWMLTPEPALRPSAVEALTHPFFAGYFND